MATPGGSSGAASAADHSGNSNQEPIEVENGGTHNNLETAEYEAEAKEAAMRDMPSPAGFRRSKVPAPCRGRSIMYDHGVRFEQDCTKPDPKKQKFLCACSRKCRAASMKGEAAINFQDLQTGNVTRHLRDVHHIVCKRTTTARATKATHNASVSKLKAEVKAGPTPGLLMMLMYVKVFIIAHLLSFSLSDSADVRVFFEVCGDDDFPRITLYPQMIKHYVAELYKATISKFAYSIRNAIAGAGGAVLHANFDLWTSKMSNEKYIAELTGSQQLSDVLLIWVQEVLKELDLDISSLFCTVTDAGSDVKRLCLKVLNSEWEWCFPQLLNCVLVEAFGTTASRAACKNVAACTVIDAGKKVVEHMNKSNVMKAKYDDVQRLLFGKATKLVNAVPHRWISTCNVLEEILRSWPALEEHYQKNEEGGVFPLAVHKTEIEELFSLMKPIADVIKDSQQSGVPTGLATVFAVVMLRCTTLAADQPLNITVPRKVVAGGSGTTETTSIERPAASLTSVTTTTRSVLATALDKRFFDQRYNEDVTASPQPGYLFEMAACMSPSFHQLHWLSTMCSTDAEAERLNKLIKSKVVDLMVSMAEGAGAQPAVDPQGRKGGDADDAGEAPLPPQKRKLGPFSDGGPSSGKTNDFTSRLLASGVFGCKSRGSKDKGPSMLTVREICQQEFDRFLERFDDTCLEDYPLGNLLWFWVNEGRALYPNMARVARVLLSVPASSAVLERDFSTAGRLITGSRSRLSAAYVEMVLFLNGNQEYIPKEVPSLSNEQAAEAVPQRLSNPSAETERLSLGELSQDNDFDEFAAEGSDF